MSSTSQERRPESPTARAGAVPVGLTRDVGFEIGVSRTVELDPAAAWDVLLGAGLPVWLGRTEAPLRCGEPYRTEDGAVGEVRSLHAGTRLRLTWQPAGWTHEATVQVTVSPRGGGLSYGSTPIGSPTRASGRRSESAGGVRSTRSGRCAAGPDTPTRPAA